MIDFLQSFIEKLDYGRGKMPPYAKIDGLLKEKSEEECERLRREFSPKKMKQLYFWMSKKLSGKEWMSTDACRRLNELGYDTKEVDVWDC